MEQNEFRRRRCGTRPTLEGIFGIFLEFFRAVSGAFRSTAFYALLQNLPRKRASNKEVTHHKLVLLLTRIFR